MSSSGRPRRQRARPPRDAVEALLARARAVGRAAARELDRTRLLRVGDRLREDPDALARRCAWCGRYESGGVWVAPDELPESTRRTLGDPPDRVTHSICPDCFARGAAPGA